MICPGCQQEHIDGGFCLPGGHVVATDPLLGKPLGDYGLVRELGRGSSGVVYLAEHLATGLNVAIKLARRGGTADVAAGRQMAREARFANQIALESVVNVFDFNDEDPLGPYVVMEYVEGEPLSDLGSQRLPTDKALALLAQLADVLAEAHERNIVHAALKPTNIFRMLNEKKESFPKLLPFGVATGPRIDGEEPGDRDVATLGSADFRAPEQTLGAPADPRMDVYALGAIGYLLATGRRPFITPTPEALQRAHAEVMPTAPHRVDVRVSRAWSATLLRALEKSPDNRFRTVRDFAEALRAAAAAPAGTGTTTVVLGGDGANLIAPVQSVPSPVPSFASTPVPQRQSPVPQAAPQGGGAGGAGGLERFLTNTPAPQRPPAPTGGVAGGLGDFVVTSVPAQQRPSPAPQPAPASPAGGAAGGLADNFVVTTPQRPSPVPQKASSPSTPAIGSPSASPFGTYATPISTPSPSAPVHSSPSQPPAQGLVLRVVVSDEKGATLGDFACNSVTRAGLIVVTPGPFPALLSRVKLAFADVNGLTCEAQVVHHVTPDQATQWKMSPGYGVQFIALSPEQRAMLESAHQGLKVPETPSGLARRPDDPAAEEVLRRYSAERANDAYAMLTISKGAPFDAIRDRVRDAKRNLEALTERPLSLAQQKALGDARARVEEVGKTLCEPETRLEYDAGRGNFEGVARCISAGLSVAQLEAARIRFLKSHPGVESKTPGNLLAAQTLEARQQMAQALDAYADTLRLDPLNLAAQQRYWAVRRQLDKA